MRLSILSLSWLQYIFQVLTTNSYDISNDAADWYRRVIREGKDWRVEPEITVPEIWPNCANDQNYPGEKSVSKIATKVKELTKIWQVGLKTDNRHTA